MGQCYGVNLHLKIKNKTRAKGLLRHYLHDIHHKFDSRESFDSLLSKLFWNLESYGEGDYRADFESSNTYQLLMIDCFTALVPELDNGSRMEIFPDNGAYVFTVINGVVEETDTVDIKLHGEDIDKLNELADYNGGNVEDFVHSLLAWIDDNKEEFTDMTGLHTDET